MKLLISNLSKTYSNGTRALNDISLEISSGMFGLLGPNGAGKSTLMRTIATIQEPDSGSITFADMDLLTQKDEVRRVLGYLPQEFGVYPKTNPLDLLDHLAVLKGVTNKKDRKELVTSLLHKTNLYDDRKKYLSGFSGGMKQRFGIAQALLSNPYLLIVDEPTAGLDPAERNRFHNLLCELGENRIVILSTHIVDDIKELCSDMAIINKGKVLYKGDPVKAIEQTEGTIFQKNISRDELEYYKQEYNVISEKLYVGKPIIHIQSEENPGNGFTPIAADLEDVYFSHIFGKAKKKQHIA